MEKTRHTKHACDSCQKKKKNVTVLDTPVKGVWILAFNVNIPLIKKEEDPVKNVNQTTTNNNVGLEIETSNSGNFLESNENCSETIYPGSSSQTNNFPQLNDLHGSQKNDLVNDFSFTNNSIHSLPQENNLVNYFSFANGSTQENNFSFINSFPYGYHNSKF
ncbi:4863_t:CDS:2 [Diversispora eburnea]|uniref:4863_t:CDS:1 n=1 Tax=Diversispora eburnea TaxID=1213867 RepID=A0A9N8ZV99_9GLOM|nr:4863_t:CDS:2 [Diversispora eburnea]